MSTPDFSSWSAMPGKLTEAWQALKEMTATAEQRDRDEMDAVMDKLDEEYNGWFTTSGDEEDAVWARFDELVAEMNTAWDELHGYWTDEFAGHVSKAKLVYDAAVVWKDDVTAKLGDHENTIATSQARMHWTGPGAEAYGKKLPDQVQAMADLKGHVATAAYGVEQAAAVLGGVYTAILNDVEGLTDAVDALPGDDSGTTFGNRVYNTRYYLEGYLETLKSYHSGDGVWSDPAGDARTAMETTVPEAKVLSTPSWPVASSESMQDMRPGAPTAPPAPITPPAPDPEQQTQQPQQLPQTGHTPESVDRSNQERTDTVEVGDEGND
ncbi:hypothetical protein GC722_15570 [Auraticoccus sp. F435]|uniref:Uncharacterized protein n=1 Tax=Auraticoccus cholistanensis TaxID=2656650 RepID=A0A6A9V1H6_9ACTN|nr:hypothetical protein [Auraticoccus cholistanensis]MVA77429.1 hypothetical protein [Auraticoccus cholistanensis]